MLWSLHCVFLMCCLVVFAVRFSNVLSCGFCSFFSNVFLNAANVLSNWWKCFLNLLVCCLFACVFLSLTHLSSSLFRSQPSWQPSSIDLWMRLNKKDRYCLPATTIHTISHVTFLAFYFSTVSYMRLLFQLQGQYCFSLTTKQWIIHAFIWN